MFFIETDNAKRERGQDVGSMAEAWILCNVCDLGIKALGYDSLIIVLDQEQSCTTLYPLRHEEASLCPCLHGQKQKPWLM